MNVAPYELNLKKNSMMIKESVMLNIKRKFHFLNVSIKNTHTHLHIRVR